MHLHVYCFTFPSACEDKDENCKLQALHGECKKKPVYIAINCPKSCRICPGMHNAQEVK